MSTDIEWSHDSECSWHTETVCDCFRGRRSTEYREVRINVSLGPLPTHFTVRIDVKQEGLRRMLRELNSQMREE